MEDPMISTSSFHVDTVGSKPSQVTVPEITLSDAKGSKKASKRLLGGLSSDKHFLESLVNRKSLARELESTDNGIGKSGTKIAAVAKEALASLQDLDTFKCQHGPGGTKLFCLIFQALEAFMWKRDPGGTKRFCLISQLLAPIM
ncbi:hypothetical protein SK128_023113 [Halocaridina rubra]|uniref:Uncharacterized protein n=1 Tax=Halocaridina rubra TaxID=373956 RepID=A0AAN9AE21_HALRR